MISVHQIRNLLIGNDMYLFIDLGIISNKYIKSSSLVFITSEVIVLLSLKAL